MPEKEWSVGIAEIKTARAPDRLTAYGLGSCVGVTLYDRAKKIGGLAHVMLPSSLSHAKAHNLGKYADTAIEVLLSTLLEEGASARMLEAKLVGGANMFGTLFQQSVPIGTRNVLAVREKLAEKEIPIKGSEVGGLQGRTMVFNLEDGKVEIKGFNRSSIWI